MTALALALVLGSAVLHAAWNLAAKRAGGGATFVWLFSALATILWLPLAAWSVWHGHPHVDPRGWLALLLSILFHAGYYVFLQKGYQHGDLSLVYPLARGSGPLLAVAGSMVLFGERPGPLTLAGAALIAISAFGLSGGGWRAFAGGDLAVTFGLATGLTIAAYTLNDAWAVRDLGMPPPLLLWGNDLGQTLLLAPVAVRHRMEAARLWRERWREILAVAVLSPLAYMMVLVALRLAPVSSVAPAREISILIAAALGARLLAEGQSRRRLLAAAGMVLGVIAIAAG
ncbi:MAG: EamA family transporter [Chloroflexota bacterium]